MPPTLREIYKRYQDINTLWERIKEEEFYYDIDGGSFFKKKANLNRKEKDRLFWKKLDDYIADVMNADFPYSIKNDRSTYNLVFTNGRNRLMGFTNELNKQKDVLSKYILAYNQDKDEDEEKEKINDKNDIERLMQEFFLKTVATEENTVIVLILCHGGYVVNYDLTINKIPKPTKKFVEIVKRAPFGYSSLLDFNYSSRYTANKTSTRFSVEQIKEKLVEAYNLVLDNITSISNEAQYTSRAEYLRLEKENPELCIQMGTPEESCIHVGFDYSHIPVLRKVYSLDPLPPEGFLRGEFAHGIVVMFKDAEGNLIQRNLNRLEDILWLRNSGYIQLSKDELNNMCAGRPLGTTTRDLDEEEDLKSVRSELLITEIDTEYLFKIIQSFPEKYSIIKIVDDSCANFIPILSKEKALQVFERYGADMICSHPREHQGGRKNRIRRRTKTSKRIIRKRTIRKRTISRRARRIRTSKKN